MEKQVHIYSVDTNYFYNEKELKIHNRLNKYYRLRTKYKNLKDKKKRSESYYENVNFHITRINKILKQIKSNLQEAFKENKQTRTLSNSIINNKNVISVFDSVLTRTLKIETNTTEISTDIMVIQTYFYEILKDIILNGYFYNNEKYICFTASAGQIRTKKTVFIKECVYQEHQNSLTCGLSIEKINTLGGVNINKYLAYLALCNSATDIWEDFNIDKTIVVDDMETLVSGIVDFIDGDTYEITRQRMDIPINHTDGCGMILPSVSNKSMMIRLPWVKGLLVPFPFRKFIHEQKKNEKNKNKAKKIGKVKDIYGKEYDLIKDGITTIFTKSQFKMYKFYSSWDEYKESFKKYNSQAGTCNKEEDRFKDAKLNYQMLQTLSDMTEQELKFLSQSSRSSISNISRDKNVMLRVLGVTKENTTKNYYQQALEIYPELLEDTYSKEILKQVKKSLVTESRAGKLNIKGKYTFICPDLYAFSEWLLLGNKNPNGLLKDGEVFCKLYSDEDKLDCLRSPHLYREHGVRKNIVDKNRSEWFVTNGLYVSCHDLISKMLMFDNDGDKSLVIADHRLIDIAERNMGDIVPLHYNMAKADAQKIDDQTIYEGLQAAYSGGNIGAISNDITKVWNNSNINLDVIKWLCMESNFVIDYAKTLYKLTRPKNINKIIRGYTKSKTPHFFFYAKDKKKENVEKVNDSVVNKLEKIITNHRLSFTAANIGVFDYKMLMSNTEVELDCSIVDMYKKFDLNKRFMEIVPIEGSFTSDNLYHYIKIRDDFNSTFGDTRHVTDVLIEYLYNNKKSRFKTSLWSSFGDLILENIRNNLLKAYASEHISCESCGERIEMTSNRKKYCESCWKKHRIEQQREWDRAKRKKKSDF